MQTATIKAAWQEGQFVLAAAGRWDIGAVPLLQPQLSSQSPRTKGAPVCLDLAGLTALDTAGALLMDQLIQRLRGQGHAVAIVGARPDLGRLLMEVRRAAIPENRVPPPPGPAFPAVDYVGKATVSLFHGIHGMLNFLGLVSVTTVRLFGAPGRFRLKPFIFHLQQTGLNALPIIGLLSFLIGIVLAYQGADQLRRFGAEIYVVNLLGIGVLREIGILMTAIIVAGRSGSAFTAQIGTMKVSQEIDAMRTLGLDPIELLVLPRLLALVVALPLVTFFANMAALTGGAVMAYGYLDIGFVQFTRQLQIAVSTTTLFVGLVKAPVFAAVIALVGCYQGLQVSGSAESVGLLTTKSVVVSIFLVILLDALFSILFSFLGI